MFNDRNWGCGRYPTARCVRRLARRRRDQPGAIRSGSMEVKFVVAAFECPGRMSAAAVSQASANAVAQPLFPLFQFDPNLTNHLRSIQTPFKEILPRWWGQDMSNH